MSCKPALPTNVSADMKTGILNVIPTIISHTGIYALAPLSNLRKIITDSAVMAAINPLTFSGGYR
jgi:hypothetical protein